MDVRVHDGLSFVTPQQRPDDAPVDAAPPKDELPVDFAALSYRYPYAGQTAFPAKLTATQLKGPRAGRGDLREHGAAAAAAKPV